MHAKKSTQAPALDRFSVTEWRDHVELAAKDMVSASKRVLDLVLSARDNVHEDTVRDALQHAFGEAYADLQGVPFEAALKAKSVKNRISDAMAVFNAKVLPNLLPGNLQHAAAECRKANRKTKEAANDEAEGADDQGATPEQVDATHAALQAMLAALNVLKGAAKGHVVVSLLEDLGELVDEISNELDAEE